MDLEAMHAAAQQARTDQFRAAIRDMASFTMDVVRAFEAAGFDRDEATQFAQMWFMHQMTEHGGAHDSLG